MYKSVFKITHLSPVINCPLQSKKKCVPVEHVFCLQTRTGGMVYCVHSRVKQCRPELAHRLKFKGVICRGHHSEAKWVSVLNSSAFINSYMFIENVQIGGYTSWGGYLGSNFVDVIMSAEKLCVYQVIDQQVILHIRTRSYIILFWHFLSRKLPLFLKVTIVMHFSLVLLPPATMHVSWKLTPGFRSRFEFQRFFMCSWCLAGSRH